MSRLNFFLALLLLSLLATSVSSASLSDDKCSIIPNFDRFDCHPDGTATQESCAARGCCWKPESWSGDPHEPGIPPCFYAQDFVNYDVSHTVIGESKMFILLKRRNIETGYPKNVDSLLVQVTGLTNDTLRIQITDSDHKRFQVPEQLLDIDLVKKTCQTSEVLYDIEYKNTDNSTGPHLVVTRRSNKQIILSISLTKLIYSDQFISVPFESLPSSSLHGLGEHYEEFEIDFNSTYKRLVFWNKDNPPEKYKPAYGFHPFYLMREGRTSPLSHGVLFFNHNLGEVTLQPSKSLVYRTTGGIVDIFVFLGPQTNDVISTKNKLIGLPTMPPLWSLGFHLCRFGQKGTKSINETLRRNLAAGVPIDVQWFDNDYMDKANDFTLNEENFGDLGDLARELHAEEMHVVPNIDPNISGSEKEGTYPPFDLGKALNIFITKANSSEIFYGILWNRESSVFPDFTNPLSDLYWSKLVTDFHQRLPFDGIWLDMNELSNGVDGELNHGCSNNTYDMPPYDPLTKTGFFIYQGTLCMTAQQHLGSFYNLHNMFPLFESMRTWNALEVLQPRKRHFILSRASVTGQARYSFHWTGDVHSSWEDLRQSITDIKSFSLYGMPMVGADICGFHDQTNPELCARWSSLGAFYPFSRNHNVNWTPDQDPAAMGPDVVNAAKYALKIRYQLIPYMYTLHYQASMDGLPMIRSLGLEYPEDAAASDAKYQFLIGPSILISPVVEPNVTQVTAYFPVGTTWIDFVSRKTLITADATERRVTIPCNISEIPVAMKEGSIVPTFTSPKKNLMTTVRESGYTLYVAPDSVTGEATGLLFADSGDEPIDSPTAKNTYIHMRVNRNNDTTYTLTSQPLKKLFTPIGGQANLKVDKIIVLNAPRKQPNSWTFGSATVSGGDESRQIKIQFDQQTHSLTLSDIEQDLNQQWTITWTV